MGCHDVRPLLPARAEELTPLEARIRAEHVAGCSRCAAEAAAYSRLGHALTVMASLEAEPADGSLERILVAIGRRRTRVTDPRVLGVAAGSAGALVVATVMLARAIRRRRPLPAAGKSRLPATGRGRPRVPALHLNPAPVLARAK
jgi:anti-sigma factor RsiW